ncbi:glycine receptor subunit alpha-2-like [Hyalella azteca]|uniref:Glycine receptor subunit alpha-2-like n=1 Tax=Hyalella azteca TaxID=294128 RepID=A0A979FU97_HYAAZ|nr:glycine receptor subunit alpha-2-like [Hyalella azteca]
MLSRITAEVKLEHLYTYEIMTIFVPTTLISMISFATFYYKWFDFQNRIMISLTTLLVQSTFFTQVSGELPKTSYMKLIDVWFLMSIIYSFCIITTHVIIEYFHEYNNPTEIAIRNSEQTFAETPENKPDYGRTSDRGVKSRHRSVMATPRNAIPEPKYNAFDLHKFGRIIIRDPYATPKKIDKWAFRLTLLTYLIFLVVFWTLPIAQKLEELSKEMTIEPDPMEL